MRLIVGMVIEQYVVDLDSSVVAEGILGGGRRRCTHENKGNAQAQQQRRRAGQPLSRHLDPLETTPLEGDRPRWGGCYLGKVKRR